jgi:phosphopentomutase
VRRAAVIVLDGVGIGEAPDAAQYGDQGSDTLGNIARVVGGLDLPNLAAAGLGRIKPLPGVPAVQEPTGAWGTMLPRSPGKDSTTGHWEIAGAPAAPCSGTSPRAVPTC